MAKVVVSTEVETYQVQGPESDYLRGEPYSYRGETGGSVTNVVAYLEETERQYYGDGHGKVIEGAAPGDTVYAVVVEYTTGDTFGRDGGQSKVLDVFTDAAEAAALAQRAEEHNYNTDGFGFTHNGVDYYTPWCGYFESLDKIEVWDIQIRGHRFESSDTDVKWNFRRGH